MAELTAKGRQKLRPTQFALPGKGEGPGGKGAGSYPINDPAHARNALSRVAQHGSPEEKAKVRAAVKKKFPGIGKNGNGNSANSRNGNWNGDSRASSNNAIASRVTARLNARDR
jgi:hypothetical protein